MAATGILAAKFNFFLIVYDTYTVYTKTFWHFGIDEMSKIISKIVKDWRFWNVLLPMTDM